MSLTKRNIIKNGISTAGQKGVKILEQLFLVPFFISQWGAAYYGEWLTLTIVPSVLAFTDLGMGSAAANGFVLKYAAGERQEARNMGYTGFLVVSAVILVAILLGSIGIAVAYHFNWLKNSLIPQNEALTALAFMILSKVLTFYMELFEARFRAARKAVLGINLNTVNSLLNIGVGLTVLMLGYGVVVYAISQFVIALLYNVFYAFIANKILSLRKEFKATYNAVYAKAILAKGLGYMMSPLWQAVLFQGTTFVVRIALGPESVAIFNTVRTLSRSVNQVYSIVNASIFPELQYEIGAGNLPKAKGILMGSMKITAILAVLGVLFMSAFGLPIYNLWTDNALQPSYTMWYFFIAATGFNAIWWTSAVVFRATNKPYQLSFAGLIFSVLAIGFTYFGAKFWGLQGAALGSLLFEVCMAAYILPKSFLLIDGAKLEFT
ncbi:lipopolysaccharide biosynthesis protein [Sphingobacterium deserti]|uniref:Polysaccharide biosynthesis protein n=1 Tax=Sphingobacterium deserti TaxID=1229276 RepID=A0A0B8T8P2_9SPHI|nr:lipopolysaccharide biosynthesis protein [Sphingobacterium deserti]KGE14310.1 hypothetical protein DI53_1924 [Sphingobacterium deserti]